MTRKYRSCETRPNLGTSISPSVGLSSSIPPGPFNPSLLTFSSSSALSTSSLSLSTEHSTVSLPFPSPSPSPALSRPSLSAFGTAFQAAVPREGDKEEWAVEEASSSIKAIMDSGSNITLMSEAMADQLKAQDLLRIVERKSPTNDLGWVRFGKRNARSSILLVIRGAGLLELVVVVAEVDVCLVSVGWFTRARDMDVVFRAAAVDLV